MFTVPVVPRVIVLRFTAEHGWEKRIGTGCDGGHGDAVAGPPLRFSAKRRLAVVPRLLRGESLERVSLATPCRIGSSASQRLALEEA